MIRNMEAARKRIREAYERQLETEPLRPCPCNWSTRYEYAKQEWEQKLQGLEAEVRQLKRILHRTLNRRLKVRTATYSLQHNR